MAANRALRKPIDDKQLRRIFPSWYAILYGAGCGFLIPWTILLSLVLPPHYISQHWDIAWVGFDAFECLLFALTALLALLHSSWTAMVSTMLGTTLLIDAWFDIMTARPDKDAHIALIEGLFLEVPLALLSFAIAHRIFNYTRKQASY